MRQFKKLKLGSLGDDGRLTSLLLKSVFLFQLNGGGADIIKVFPLGLGLSIYSASLLSPPLSLSSLGNFHSLLMQFDLSY